MNVVCPYFTKQVNLIYYVPTLCKNCVYFLPADDTLFGFCNKFKTTTITSKFFCKGPFNVGLKDSKNNNMNIK